MTTRKRPTRRQGDELACGQKGCYRPDSGRDLTWCVYAQYWRYSCNKPEGVDVVLPTEPDVEPDDQIGAPVRLPAQPRTKTPSPEAPEEGPVQDAVDEGVDAPEGETPAPAAEKARHRGTGSRDPGQRRAGPRSQFRSRSQRRSWSKCSRQPSPYEPGPGQAQAQ